VTITTDGRTDEPCIQQTRSSRTQLVVVVARCVTRQLHGPTCLRHARPPAGRNATRRLRVVSCPRLPTALSSPPRPKGVRRRAEIDIRRTIRTLARHAARPSGHVTDGGRLQVELQGRRASTGDGCEEGGGWRTSHFPAPYLAGHRTALPARTAVHGVGRSGHTHLAFQSTLLERHIFCTSLLSSFPSSSLFRSQMPATVLQILRHGKLWARVLQGTSMSSLVTSGFPSRACLYRSVPFSNLSPQLSSRSRRR